MSENLFTFVKDNAFGFTKGSKTDLILQHQSRYTEKDLATALLKTKAYKQNQELSVLVDSILHEKIEKEKEEIKKPDANCHSNKSGEPVRG